LLYLKGSNSNLFSQGGKIIEDADLEVIGIKDIEHRKKILEATKSLSDVKPIGIYNL